MPYCGRSVTFVFILEFFLNMKIMWIIRGIIIVNNEHKYILKVVFFYIKISFFFFLSRFFNICIMYNIESKKRKKILIVTEKKKWDEPVGAISEWDSSWLQKFLLSFANFFQYACLCVFLCNKNFFLIVEPYWRLILVLVYCLLITCKRF